MTYNSQQIGAALAEYVTDPDGKGYAAMQAAMEAAPRHVAPNAPPRAGLPPNNADMVAWNNLTPAEQATRIADEATRQSVLATQGALWLAAMTESVRAANRSTLTNEELYELVDDAEEAVLLPAAAGALNKLYMLQDIDMNPGSPGPPVVPASKAFEVLERIFTTAGDGPTRRALNGALQNRTQTRAASRGLPEPFIGLFERLSIERMP